MSQNFRFAVAKVRLFSILTIFFGQNFSNNLYLLDNQQGFSISIGNSFQNGVCFKANLRRFEAFQVCKHYYPPRDNLKISFPFPAGISFFLPLHEF
jgi:hypothetical protein